jgi:RNA polymerase sigma-70 factor, ECF subfamily
VEKRELESDESTPRMSDVTALLDQWNDGDPDALKRLLAIVYPELKRVADDLLRRERADHTLQPTALVHEAYIRLTGVRGMRLESRRHFYGAAAMAMRRILVEHARHRKAMKRGGADLARAPIEEALNAAVDLRIDFERLDEALEELTVFAPEKARIVELRYFAGLSIQETAALLDIAPATVKRHWTFARAWLHRALTA